MSKKAVATERIHIRVTPKLKKKLEDKASDQGRSLSNYIKRVLENSVE